MSDEKCPRCDGCGQVADTETGEPWTAWTELPAHSAVAVLAGIVKPIPCPTCGGSGTRPMPPEPGPKKVSVRIRASQRVYYDQNVEMTEAEWAAVRKSFAESNEQEIAEIGEWLDLGNVDRADDFDADEVEVQRLDESGKAVESLP